MGYGDLTSLDLKGKKVAVFGVGDQAGYADNFCDAIDELASCFKAQGADIVGAWSTDGYDHEESKSIDGGKFVGLPCDEDNQPDMSEDSVKALPFRRQCIESTIANAYVSCCFPSISDTTH